jgi:uncharacterized membrane protein
MKVLLFSQNPVVNKLVMLSAQKTGDEIMVAEGLADVPEGTADLLIIDEGVYGPSVMDALERRVVLRSKLYMGGQIREVPAGFERSLKKPFLPTDLLKLMSEVEEELSMTLPDEPEAFEESGLELESGEEEPEAADFGVEEEPLEFEETMFDDLEKLDELEEALPEEEEEGGHVLDAEELEEVQHLLEEAEAPDVPDDAERSSAGLSSDTLDEVNAVLEGLDLQETTDEEEALFDEEELDGIELDEEFSETVNETGEVSGTEEAETEAEERTEAGGPEAAETEDFADMPVEEPEEIEEPEETEEEPLAVDLDDALFETAAEEEETALEEEPDLSDFELDDTYAETAAADMTAAVEGPEEEISGTSGEPSAAAAEAAESEGGIESDRAEAEPSGEWTEPEPETAHAAVTDEMQETESEEASAAPEPDEQEETPVVPELGEIELEEETAPESGPEPAAPEAFPTDETLKELEAEIENAVSDLSDEELAEELDEAALLEIVNEADKQEQREAVADEFDRLDTAELKAALGEVATEEAAVTTEEETVTPKEGLEALQTLVKALENENIAKSLKGMNISINISFGAKSE